MEYKIEDLQKLTVNQLIRTCKLLKINGIYNIRKHLLIQKLISYYCTYEPRFPYLSLCMELKEEIAKYLNLKDILSFISSSKVLYEELGRTNVIIWKNIIYKSISDDLIYNKDEYTYPYDLVKQFVKKKYKFLMKEHYYVESHKDVNNLHLMKYILESYNKPINLKDQDIIRLAQWGNIECFNYLTTVKKYNISLNTKI